MHYIDIRYKWLIQAVVHHGIIDLRHIPTAEMPANGLTKPLEQQKHADFVQ